jgi:uncharacterized protein YcbX
VNNIIVNELAIYPVKSLGQISLSTSAIEAFGLQHDRRWMVIDAKHNMLTQRQQSRMCLIQVSPGEDNIVLSAPGMQHIHIQRPDDTVKRQVTVWHDTCNAYDAGDAAAKWITHFLRVPCRLVYFPDDEHRSVDPKFANAQDKTAFSDGFPILLTSVASLEDLNNKMTSPINMRRFRPNIVVSGNITYAEDSWKRIKIGDITMRIVKPCSRCVIPSIDPNTGERGNEPTQALIKYRKKNNKVFFGQNVIPDCAGTISIGMPVEILE